MLNCTIDPMLGATTSTGNIRRQMLHWARVWWSSIVHLYDITLSCFFSSSFPSYHRGLFDLLF